MIPPPDGKTVLSLFGALVLAIAFSLLVGCSTTIENGNGPLGPEKVTVAPAWPWRVAPADRGSRRVEACPEGRVESETCEGGTCPLPR